MSLDSSCPYSDFMVFINPTVSFIGVIFSIFTIIVLSNPLFKELCYVYLRLQTYSTLLNLAIKVLQPLYYCCDKCETSKQRSVIVFFIGFIVYASSIFEMMTQYFCVFSGLFCCLLIWNQRFTRVLQNVLSHYKLIAFLMFLVSAGLFSVQLLIWSVSEEIDGMFVANYDNSTNLHYWELTANISRDGISLLALLVINIILMIKIRKIMEEKLQLLNKNVIKKIHTNNKLEPIKRSISVDMSNKESSVLTLSEMNCMKINRIKKRQTVTILTTCINNFIGRMPILITYSFHSRKDNKLLFHVSALLIYLSNCITFFLIYFSNEKFKRVFDRYFFRKKTKKRQKKLMRSLSN